MPQYIVRDPDAIKQIAVKGFEYFEDQVSFPDKTDKLWGNTLFFMKGEKWRRGFYVRIYGQIEKLSFRSTFSYMKLLFFVKSLKST